MTSVLAKFVILHFSRYHEYIAPISSPICITPCLPPFDYPVRIRLAKDGLAVIVELILPSLVMSGHYVTCRAPNYGIAALV